jgi:hypothetical protein
MKNSITVAVLFLFALPVFAQKDVKVIKTKPLVTTPVTSTNTRKASGNIDNKQMISDKVNLPGSVRMRPVDIESPGNEVSGQTVRREITGYAQPGELVTVTITPTIKSYAPSFYLGSGGAETGEVKTFATVTQKVTADAKGNWKTAAVFLGIDGNQEDAVYRIEAVSASGKSIQKVKNTTRATHAPALLTSNTDGQGMPLGMIVIPKGKGTPNTDVSISVYVYANVKEKKSSSFFKQFIEYTTPVLNIIKTSIQFTHRP